LDRVNISVAAPFIMSHYGWDETQMGVVFSAFFAGYVIFMIPGGIVTDRYGARKVLTWGVALWSLFTAINPLFCRIWSMSFCRYMIGTGQGVYWPAVNTLVAHYVAFHNRAKVLGFILSGITLGSVIGFPLGSLIIRIWNWHAIFYFLGLIGFVWIAFWLSFSRSLIPDGDESPKSSREPIPWTDLITNRSVLGLTLSYFCHNYAGYMFLVWLPTYLMNVHGFSLAAMGIAAALPALASSILMNISGWFSDYLIQRGKSREFSRKIILYLGMGGSAFFLICVIWAENPYILVGLLTLSSAAKAISTPIYWSLSVDMSPRHAGILSSIMNTSGNIAGIAASALTGWTVSCFSGWNPAIVMGAIITFLGVVIAVPTIKASEIF
jgi:MFS family permease